MRVLVVVLAVEREPWAAVQNAQRSTWAAADIPTVPVRFLHGRHVPGWRVFDGALRRVLPSTRGPILRATARLPASDDGQVIRTVVPESYYTVAAKTLAAFRHALRRGPHFDFLLRTNSSTYVHRPRLLRWLGNAPARDLYAGFIGNRDGVTFASGTGILMSRDVVEHLTVAPWDLAMVDDVGIGNVLNREPLPLRRVDVLTAEAVDELSVDGLAGSFLVRCKVPGRMRGDITAMHRVHELIGNTSA